MPFSPSLVASVAGFAPNSPPAVDVDATGAALVEGAVVDAGCEAAEVAVEPPNNDEGG